jgi:3-oxoadipate enol-lactonase
LPVLRPLLPLAAASLPPWYDLLSPAALRRPARETAHPGPLRAVLHEVSRHDWSWYRQLAVALAQHGPLDVSAVRCPATLLAGRYDSLVDHADVRAAAPTLSGARLRVLTGTHFLPLQYPEVMLQELRRLDGPQTSRD